MMGEKGDKIAQMGKNVFGIENDNEAVIAKIESIFQSVGVPTKLNEYEIDDKVIQNIHAAFTSHGYTAIGENGTITLDTVSTILTDSMSA